MVVGCTVDFIVEFEKKVSVLIFADPILFDMFNYLVKYNSTAIQNHDNFVSILSVIFFSQNLKKGLQHESYTLYLFLSIPSWQCTLFFVRSVGDV